MLKKFRQWRKDKALENVVKSNPIMQLALENVKKNWHEIGILSSLSEEATQTHLSEFFSIVNGILEADDGIKELRLRIVDYVMAYSQYMTLYVTPENKDLLFIKESPYVTGELNEHIGVEGTQNLTEKFREIYFNNPSVTSDELRDFCSLSMAIMNFYIEGLDMIRIYLDDFNKLNLDKDWLRPFKIAMAEHAEYEHREKLGLPQIMDASMNFKRTLFVNYVANWPNPLMEYEEAINKIEQE
jgi:hypothetical protein